MFSLVDISPFDDFYRLRRQMNDIFSEFDHNMGTVHDPLVRDPLVSREQLHTQPQQRLQQHQKDTKAEEKYGAGANEQKADSMNVESSSSSDGSDSLTHSNQNTAPALLRLRHDWLSPRSKVHWPKCDVVENADNYLVTCDLPGMSKEDVKLNINEHGIMTISAEHSSSSEQKDPQAKYHRVERHYGKFERSLPLPKNVELDHVSAKHENGLLKINIPKKPQTKVDGNKNIQIQ